MTAPRATLSQVADHIDHIRKVAGIDHIGLGGDFDGITDVVAGLEDVSKYPDLTAELLKRGYKDDDIKKILGLNVLRVMRQAEKVAAGLQKTRQPSTATIEQLDGKKMKSEDRESQKSEYLLLTLILTSDFTHSARSAINGSTVVARRAGIRHATIPASDEHHRDAGEDERIARRRLVEIRRQHAAGGERADNADRQPDHDQRQSLAHDHHQHAVATRAERHAQAELLGALLHGGGNHAADAGERDEQREGGEHAEQCGGEPRRRERLRSQVVERLHVLDRLVRIDRVHGAAQHVAERRRITGGPHQHLPGKAERRLRERHVDLRHRLLREAELPDVADHADHGEPFRRRRLARLRPLARRQRRRQRHPAADRIRAVPVASSSPC